MIWYWFEFALNNYDKPPIGIKLGCGITANSFDEAEDILQKKIFKDKIVPPILKCISNIDISTLDVNHVLLNMGSPVRKGVWFPLGYE
jgi:hypothetical protein